MKINSVFLKSLYEFGKKAYTANSIIASQEEELEAIMDSVDALLTDHHDRDYDKVFKSLMANFFNNVAMGKENSIILVANLKEDFDIEDNDNFYIENFEEVCKEVAKDYQFKVSFLKEENGQNSVAEFRPEFVMI